MKTNVEALKELYIKLGGSLTDTYDDISGGAPVGEMSLISDLILAVSKKANTGGGGGSDDVFRAEITIEYDEEKEELVPRLVTPFNDVYNAINGGKVVIATIETEIKGTATSITAYGTSAYDEDGDKWVYFTILDGETSNIRFIYFYNGDKYKPGVESYVLIEDPAEFAEGSEKSLLQGTNKGAEWLETDRAVGQMKVNFESLNSPLSMTALEIQMHDDIGDVCNAVSNNKLAYGKVYASINGVTHQLMLIGTAAHEENRLNPDTQQYEFVFDVTFFCADNGIGGDSGFHEYYLTLTGTGENLYATLQQVSSGSPTPAEGEIFKIQFSENGGTWGADKTLAEIATAYQAGKTLLGRFEKFDTPTTLVLKSVESGFYSFSFIGVNWYQGGIGTGYQPNIVNVTIFGNDSVTVNEMPINAKQTVQFSNNNGAISANKGFYDIVNAYNGGQTINATYNGRVFQLINVEQQAYGASRDLLHFISTDFDYPTANTVVVHKMMLDSNAGVAYSTATISATVSSVYDGIFGPQ